MTSRFFGPATLRRWRATGAAVLLGAGLAPGHVFAGDRCEGTLCDFYYDHVAQPQPAASSQAAPSAHQAAASPAPAGGDSLLGRLFGGAPQPQQAGATAPAKRPLVAVQGGGVIGMMQGGPQERCTGTLCDLYYGGPPREQPAARPTPAAASPLEEPAVEDEAPAPTRRLRAAPSADDQPRCAAKAGGDPWQCYR